MLTKTQKKPVVDPSSWRFTKGEYITARDAYLAKSADRGWNRTRNWTRQRKPKDIILGALMTLDPDPDVKKLYCKGDKTENENHRQFIIFSYVCEYSVLPEELIDDLIYISSGFFDFELWIWNDEAVKQAIDIMTTSKKDYWPAFRDMNNDSPLGPLGVKYRTQYLNAVDNYSKYIDRLGKTIDELTQMYTLAKELRTQYINDYYGDQNRNVTANNQLLAATVSNKPNPRATDITILRNTIKMIDRLDWFMISVKQPVRESYLRDRFPLMGITPESFKYALDRAKGFDDDTLLDD